MNAKQHGLIKSVKVVLEKVGSTNFRLPSALVEQIIKDSGE